MAGPDRPSTSLIASTRGCPAKGRGGDLQWGRRRARPGRPATARQSRRQFPHQRPAAGDRRGPVHLERQEGRSRSRRKIQAWRLAAFWGFFGSALHRPRRLDRQPIQFGDAGKPVGKFRHLFAVRAEGVGGDDDRGIGIFARVSSSPSDRNLIDRYADGGIEFIGLSDARPKDQVGISPGDAHVSSPARALDLDFQQLMGANWPLRRSETLVTAVYQYEVRAGWTLQPNFQYLLHPRRRRHQPDRTAAGKIAEGCGGAWVEDRAEVLTGSPPGRG